MPQSVVRKCSSVGVLRPGWFDTPSSDTSQGRRPCGRLVMPFTRGGPDDIGDSTCAKRSTSGATQASSAHPDWIIGGHIVPAFICKSIQCLIKLPRSSTCQARRNVSTPRRAGRSRRRLRQLLQGAVDQDGSPQRGPQLNRHCQMPITDIRCSRNFLSSRHYLEPGSWNYGSQAGASDSIGRPIISPAGSAAVTYKCSAGMCH
jgi:hypothetical protein